MHNFGYKLALARRVCRYSDARPPRKTDGVLLEPEIPPHMRGKVIFCHIPVAGHGITPAYAGKSWQGCYHQGHHEDHPRICGEKAVSVTLYNGSMGSPPHMQGKEIPKGLVHRAAGITPAYAGKRTPGASAPGRGRDHPRICGEKSSGFMLIRLSLGSPPHMRGKGSPARAVKSRLGITPRVCGEKSNRQ